jgi:hypothetical protein
MALGDVYRPGNFIEGVLPALPAMVLAGGQLSGNGSPEGAVPGSPGQLYVDLLTSNLWQKAGGTQKIGWLLIGVAGAGGGGGGGGGGSMFTGSSIIPINVFAGSVTGLALSFIPSRVLLNVRAITGNLMLFAEVVGSPTADGFNYNLSATTDAPYILDYALPK